MKMSTRGRYALRAMVDVAQHGATGPVLEAVRVEPYVREVTVDDGHVRLYVDRGEVAVPRILRTLDGAGLAPRTITLARPSLDDVFLRETGRSLREEVA